MVILIAGASHSGKTCLAQKLLEKYHYPYLSLDHLKMGLIRAGETELTPDDDGRLTDYLWPIAREIVKTAIENRQNLTVEGCYIPCDWKTSFSEEYLAEIRYICLVLSERYIREHFRSIKDHANDIENRLDDACCTVDFLLKENAEVLGQCRECGAEYLLIDGEYDVDFTL